MSSIPTIYEYQNTLYKTLPAGLIWPPATEESNTKTLVDAIAYDTRECALDACNMMDGSFPSSLTYISDWERVLGLPKIVTSRTYFYADQNNAGDSLGTISLTSNLPTDINVRVAQVLTFFRNTGYNNEAFYETLADLFTLTITITQPSTFDIIINITSGTSESIIYFTSLANFFKPVYTRLTITL